MPPIYKKRPGTYDFSIDYHMLVPAYFAVILNKNENIGDFQLRCKDASFGRFDDLIIDVEMKNGERFGFAFELKYSHSRRKFSLKQLEETKGVFSLRRYIKGLPYDERTREINYNFILYTNREFDVQIGTKFRATPDDSSIAKLFFDTSEDGNVYKLEMGERKELSDDVVADDDDVVDDDYQAFFKRFSLFTHQIDVDQMKISILDVLKYEEQFLKYIDFFRKWFQEPFGQIIDKSILNLQLVDIFLSSFIINDYQLSDYKINLKLFESSLKEFDVTVIDETKENFLEKMKEASIFEKKTFDENEMLLLAKRNRIIDTHTKRLDADTKMKIYNYFQKELIIVDFNETSKGLVYQALTLYQKTGLRKIRFVLLGHGVEDSKISNLVIFRNFKDLARINQALFENIFKRCTFSLQNRPQIFFNELVDCYEEILEFTTPKEIYQMLDDNYAIGKKEENLPPYYIPRTVFTLVLDFEAIVNHCVKTKDLLIINCRPKSEHFKDLLNEKKVTVMRAEENLKKVQISSTSVILSIDEEECFRLMDFFKRNEDRPVHYLKAINEEQFLLVKSTNNTLPTNKISVMEEEIHEVFDNSINVLCAQPGMGKSTLFKYLKISYDSKFWTLEVDLKIYNGFLKKKQKVDDILKLFLDTERQSDDVFARKLEEVFLEKKKMVIFLDGLDEIENECVDNVLEYARELASLGFRVWLSSRQNLQKKIEDHLKIFVIEINELDEKQQRRYIHRRLHDVYGEEKIKEICNKVFFNAGIINVSQVLGVPLQLYIITQIFLDDKSHYDIINDENFVLTKLYNIFFQGRFKYSTGKVEGKNVHLTVAELDDHLEKYEIPALQSLLDDDDFAKLDLDLRRTKRFFEKISKVGDPLGTIVRLNHEGKAVFLDRSFAEYFACRFFVNNFNKAKLLKHLLFADRYRNLLLMLNMMLAEDKPSHLQILYKICDVSIKGSTLDKGGRNLLHIAACVATQHPRKLNKDFKGEASVCKEVVKKVIHIDPFQKDNLFEYSALDYALASGALYVAEEILKNHTKPSDIKEIVQKHCNFEYILYYSMKLDYRHLLAALSANEILSLNIIRHNLIDVHLKEKFRDILETVPECYKDIVSRRLEDQLIHYEIPALQFLLDEHSFAQLKLDLRRTNSFLGKIKKDGDPLEIMEKESGKHEVVFKHQIYADYFAGVFLSNNFDKARILIKQLFSEKYKTLLHILNTLLIGNRSLHWAVIFKNIDYIKSNVELDECFDSGGRNPLHLASFSGDRYPNLEFSTSEISDDHMCKNREFFNILIPRFDSFEKDKLFEWSSLEYALANENLLLVEQILEKCDNSSKNEDDVIKTIGKYYEEGTIVYYSCRFGFKNLLSIILKKDSYLINTTNSDGNSLIHLAIKMKNRQMFDLVLENGIDTSIRNNKGETVLHYAVLGQDLAMVYRMIQQKIDLNLRNDLGETALHYATKESSFDIVYMLLRESADINARNDDGETPLHYALRAENFEVVKLLIKEHCDILMTNRFGDTSLHYAVGRENVHNREKFWRIALHLETERSKSDVVKLLLEQGIDIKRTNDNWETTLHYAAFSGNVEVVRLLLDREVDVKEHTVFKETALHYAALSGNAEVVKLLLDYKADLNATTRYDESILHYAVQCGNVDIIRLLLDRGASIDAVARYEETPLHYAVENGYYDVVKVLLDRGSKVNAVTRYKETALHYAVRRADIEIFDLLIQNGADVNLANSYGKTVLDYARKSDSAYSSGKDEMSITTCLRKEFKQDWLDRQFNREKEHKHVSQRSEKCSFRNFTEFPLDSDFRMDMFVRGKRRNYRWKKESSAPVFPVEIEESDSGTEKVTELLHLVEAQRKRFAEKLLEAQRKQLAEKLQQQKTETSLLDRQKPSSKLIKESPAPAFPVEIEGSDSKTDEATKRSQEIEANRKRILQLAEKLQKPKTEMSTKTNFETESDKK